MWMHPYILLPPCMFPPCILGVLSMVGCESNHLTKLGLLRILLEPMGIQEPYAKIQRCFPYSDISLFETWMILAAWATNLASTVRLRQNLQMLWFFNSLILNVFQLLPVCQAYPFGSRRARTLCGASCIVPPISTTSWSQGRYATKTHGWTEKSSPTRQPCKELPLVRELPPLFILTAILHPDHPSFILSIPQI